MNIDQLRKTFSPWIDVVIQDFSKSFLFDYDTEILEFLHRNIDKEIETVYKDSNKEKNCVVARTRALYTALTYLYNHFSWKMSHQKDSPNVKRSYVKLLAEIIKTGLILSKGAAKSEWINRVLTAIRLFTADPVLIYDAVLLVSFLKPKYHKAYIVILRHVLTNEDQEHITEPLVYMEVILLFRRLKGLLKNRLNRSFVISMATKIKPPCNLISWLSSLGIKGVSGLKYKTIAKQLMKNKVPEILIKKVRDIALNCYVFNSGTNKNRFQDAVDESSDIFVIDSSSVADSLCPSTSGSSISKKSNAMPSIEKKKQSANTTPSKEKKRQSANTAPSKEKKRQTDNTTPSKEKKKQSANTIPSKEKQRQTDSTTPSKKKKRQSANTTPSKEKKSQSANTTPAKEKKSQSANTTPAKEKRGQSVLKQKHSATNDEKTAKSASDETNDPVYYIHDYSNLVANCNHSDSSNPDEDDMCNNSDSPVAVLAARVHSSITNESKASLKKKPKAKSGYKKLASNSELKSSKCEREVLNVSESDSSTQRIPFKKFKKNEFFEDSPNAILKNSAHKKTNTNIDVTNVNETLKRKRKKMPRKEFVVHKMDRYDEPVYDHFLICNSTDNNSVVSKSAFKISDKQMSENSESDEVCIIGEVQRVKKTNISTEFNKDQQYETNKRKFSSDIDFSRNTVSYPPKKVVILAQNEESCPSSTSDKDNSHDLKKSLETIYQTSPSSDLYCNSQLQINSKSFKRLDCSVPSKENANKSNQHTKSNEATTKFSDRNILSNKSSECSTSSPSSNSRYFHICSDIAKSSVCASKISDSIESLDSYKNILNSGGNSSGKSLQEEVRNSGSISNRKNSTHFSNSKFKVINLNLQPETQCIENIPIEATSEDHSYFIDKRSSNSVSSEVSDNSDMDSSDKFLQEEKLKSNSISDRKIHVTSNTLKSKEINLNVQLESIENISRKAAVEEKSNFIDKLASNSISSKISDDSDANTSDKSLQEEVSKSDSNREIHVISNTLKSEETDVNIQLGDIKNIRKEATTVKSNFINKLASNSISSKVSDNSDAESSDKSFQEEVSKYDSTSDREIQVTSNTLKSKVIDLNVQLEGIENVRKEATTDKSNFISKLTSNLISPEVSDNIDVDCSDKSLQKEVSKSDSNGEIHVTSNTSTSKEINFNVQLESNENIAREAAVKEKSNFIDKLASNSISSNISDNSDVNSSDKSLQEEVSKSDSNREIHVISNALKSKEIDLNVQLGGIENIRKEATTDKSNFINKLVSNSISSEVSYNNDAESSDTSLQEDVSKSDSNREIHVISNTLKSKEIDLNEQLGGIKNITKEATTDKSNFINTLASNSISSEVSDNSDMDNSDKSLQEGEPKSNSISHGKIHVTSNTLKSKEINLNVQLESIENIAREAVVEEKSNFIDKLASNSISSNISNNSDADSSGKSLQEEVSKSDSNREIHITSNTSTSKVIDINVQLKGIENNTKEATTDKSNFINKLASNLILPKVSDNSDMDSSDKSLQEKVSKSNSISDENINVTSNTSKSKVMNLNVQLENISKESTIENKSVISKLVNNNSISSEASNSKCEQNFLVNKKDPNNSSLPTACIGQEIKISLACHEDSENVSSAENVQSESKESKTLTKPTDTSFKYIDPDIASEDILCSESSSECLEIAIPNDTLNEVYEKSLGELKISSSNKDLSDISISESTEPDSIVNAYSKKVTHLKESDNVSSDENIECKSKNSEIRTDTSKCINDKVSEGVLFSRDDSNCSEVATSNADTSRETSQSSFSSLKICISENELSDNSICADTSLKERNESESLCNKFTDIPLTSNLKSYESGQMGQLETQINFKPCNDSKMTTNSFVENTPPIQSADSQDCYKNTTNFSKKSDVPSNVLCVEPFREQNMQQLNSNKRTADGEFKVHKGVKFVENVNEKTLDANNRCNSNLTDVSNISCMNDKKAVECSSSTSQSGTPDSNTLKMNLSFEESRVLCSALQKKSKYSLKGDSSEFDILNEDMEILQEASKAMDAIDSNGSIKLQQTSNTKEMNKNLRKAEPGCSKSCNRFSDQENSLSNEAKIAHSEFPYSCESKNYLSFSDISLTNKETSIEGSDLKSPNQIRNFAFAATTEKFSSYRYDLCSEEDKTEAGPVSKDDVSSYTHEISDDAKSQNISSDSNYDECESEPSSEEAESQTVEDEINQTENSVEKPPKEVNSVKTDNVESNEATTVVPKMELILCEDKNLDELDHICLPHSSRNQCICIKEFDSNNELNEEAAKLPRHSLRLKNKAEIKNTINLDDSKVDSSPENAVQKEWEVPEIEMVEDSDVKQISLENNDTVCDNQKDTLSIPLVENVHVLPQSSDTVLITSSARESQSRKCKSKVAISKISETPPKRFSLRQKSKRRTDESSKLGIDFSQLHLDSPSSRKNPIVSLNKHDLLIGKYVLKSDSPKNDDLGDLTLFAKRGTRSSVAKTLKEDPIPSTPGYNLRTRKPIIAPGKFVI